MGPVMTGATTLTVLPISMGVSLRGGDFFGDFHGPGEERGNDAIRILYLEVIDGGGKSEVLGVQGWDGECHGIADVIHGEAGRVQHGAARGILELASRRAA